VPQLRVGHINELLSEGISMSAYHVPWKFLIWTTVLLLCRMPHFGRTPAKWRRPRHTNPEGRPSDVLQGFWNWYRSVAFRDHRPWVTAKLPKLALVQFTALVSECSLLVNNQMVGDMPEMAVAVRTEHCVEYSNPSQVVRDLKVKDRPWRNRADLLESLSKRGSLLFSRQFC
jgi:hypothetical protein